VIVAEGDKSGGAYQLAEQVKEKFNFYDIKVTILGHLQRGGSPSSFDRVLASRLGFAAVKELLNGKTRQMIGLRGNSIVLTPLEEALNSSHFKLEDDLMEMVSVLSI
jgi:6-phosphofructokinase 1